jgi:tetratricopeptide (TPR) repeat protein
VQVRNIMVPPDTSPEEQMRLLQQAMEEDAKNKQRAAAEETRRAAAAKAERIARSDVWCYVLSGAGSDELNGPWHRDGSAVRNGARVYTNGAGFVMSREVISGGEGWIIGRAPKAYYGFQTKDVLAPETGWSVQEHGKPPAPTVTAVEPFMAVETAKQAGNAAFKLNRHADAIEKYGEALRIAKACEGAYGLSDELLARLHANRAEAHLQMEQAEEAEVWG